jgi:LmbE family N-acetylglucosaminyl deacetylase
VDDPGGPLVVLSAHPDDEVLGVGAWLAGQTGRATRFVVATDGEASHPGSPTTSPAALTGVRRRELRAALRALGHADPDVTHLGLRDAALPDDEPALRTALAGLLVGAALVLTPYEDDGHGDHDVLGAVTRDVAPTGTTVWRYPVWRWTSTEPASGRSWLDGAARLPERPEGRARKLRALEAFTSQLRPLSPHPADAAVLTPALLAHARTAPEVVLT